MLIIRMVVVQICTQSNQSVCGASVGERLACLGDAFDTNVNNLRNLSTLGVRLIIPSIARHVDHCDRNGVSVRWCSGQTTCLTPIRTGFDSPRGRSQIFARENRAGRCRFSAGFLGALPFPLPLHSSIQISRAHSNFPLFSIFHGNDQWNTNGTTASSGYSTSSFGSVHGWTLTDNFLTGQWLFACRTDFPGLPSCCDNTLWTAAQFCLSNMCDASWNCSFSHQISRAYVAAVAKQLHKSNKISTISLTQRGKIMTVPRNLWSWHSMSACIRAKSSLPAVGRDGENREEETLVPSPNMKWLGFRFIRLFATFRGQTSNYGETYLLPFLRDSSTAPVTRQCHIYLTQSTTVPRIHGSDYVELGTGIPAMFRDKPKSDKLSDLQRRVGNTARRRIENISLFLRHSTEAPVNLPSRRRGIWDNNHAIKNYVPLGSTLYGICLSVCGPTPKRCTQDAAWRANRRFLTKRSAYSDIIIKITERLTVLVILLIWRLPFHQVMVASGRDPVLRHSTSYLRSADTCFSFVRIHSISDGPATGNTCKVACRTCLTEIMLRLKYSKGAAVNKWRIGVQWTD
ncbi:hypothetical protein PR048_025397 [Dryococelus australis]|uniref:Uncharacterized protein n=1 Tax=Dryococelus australis TaxID=614101 RepID=A0ABQ9GRA9_9NEOP|nr:hypothetical protein PR048_025397 [Dryococelus australis]